MIHLGFFVGIQRIHFEICATLHSQRSELDGPLAHAPAPGASAGGGDGGGGPPDAARVAMAAAVAVAVAVSPWPLLRRKVAKE